MQLTFYGGVQSVTGANYIVSSGSTKIAIDCGLFQGGSFADKLNFGSFLYDPASLDAVFITHSHIDHIGRLPTLVRAGFHGAIFSTPPARDAAHLLLLDSEHLMLEAAKDIRRDPLYSIADVEQVMRQWKTAQYYHPVTVGDVTITLYNAGHIIGSACILLEDKTGTRIVFSGDLGNSPAPLLGDKDVLPRTDYCVIESTYGNRLHEDRARRQELLEDVIEDAIRNGGTLIIPAFAMERTQELLSEIDLLVSEGRIPKVPVYLDSPLAIKLTEVYQRYGEYILPGSHFDFRFPNLHITETTEQSKAINAVLPPKIIIAGSGMSNGGRILHHEKAYLPDPKSTILFIGYQAQGSLGRQIIDDATTVKIFGEEVPVRCHVKQIGGYSAHADQAQLLQWLAPQRAFLKNIFIVQGEGEESEILAQKIKDDLAVSAEIPALGKTYDL